jgi:hypothetical protein
MMDAVELWSRTGCGDGVTPDKTRMLLIRAMLRDLRELDISIRRLQMVSKEGILQLVLYKLEILDYSIIWGTQMGSFLNRHSFLNLLGHWVDDTRMTIQMRLQKLQEIRLEAVKRLGRCLYMKEEEEALMAESSPELSLLYRPTWVSRYLPTMISLAGLSLITIKALQGVDWKVVFDIARDLYSASHNLITDWIVSPMTEIWRTIRYRNTKLALVSATALKADMGSLERMVVDFAKKQYPDIPELVVIEQVRQGDATLILQRYEEELKSPLKNVLLGDLVSMLLIQVQKSKVDLEAAMMAMDRLLKANELNFELLAVIPLLVLLYTTIGTGRYYVQRWMNRGDRYYVNSLRRRMHSLEQLLNSNFDEAQLGGEILLAVQSVLEDWSHLTRHIRTDYEDVFYDDLSELLSTLSAERKLWTMSRMFHYYPCLQVSK